MAEETQSSDAFPWPQGKRAAVSFTFDDARLSQIDRGIPLLNAYGIKATFYVLPDNLLQRLEGWRQAVADGHEIGNHTYTHPCTGNYTFSRRNALEEYTLRQIEKDIRRANEAIFGTLGVKPVSFAYPCGQAFVGRGVQVKSYVPLVAKLFRSGRGWLNEGTNDPWLCDPAQLLAVESDGKLFDELKAQVDKTAAQGRWLIFAGHETDDGGPQTTRLSSLEELCRYLTDPANGIWVATVDEIARYVEEQRRRDR